MPIRHVHFKQYGSTPISDLDVNRGKKFINLQHVQLWMSQKMGVFNFSEKSLAGQIEWLKDNIQTAFTDKFSQDDLVKSVIGDESRMVANLIQHEDNHSLLKEMLSFLVNTVAQTYMRNNISDKDKESCKLCVNKVFEVLDVAKKTEGYKYKKLAKEVEINIRRDLTNTLLSHERSLLSFSQTLFEEYQWLMQNSHQLGDKAELEEISQRWLKDTNKLNDDLSLLQEQIQALEPYIDEKQLGKGWKEKLPNFTLGNENEDVDFQSRKAQLLGYVKQQQTILQMCVRDFRTREFIDKAQSDNLELQQNLGEMEKSLAKAQSEADDLKVNLKAAHEEKGQLETELQTEKQALLEKTQEHEKAQSDNLELQQNLGEMEKSLAKAQSEADDLKVNLKAAHEEKGQLETELQTEKQALLEKTQEHEKAQSDNLELQQNLGEMEKSLAKAQSEADDLKVNLKAAHEEKGQLETELQTEKQALLEKTQEHEKAQSDNLELQQNLGELEKSRLRLGVRQKA